MSYSRMTLHNKYSTISTTCLSVGCVSIRNWAYNLLDGFVKDLVLTEEQQDHQQHVDLRIVGLALHTFVHHSQNGQVLSIEKRNASWLALMFKAKQVFIQK